MTNEYRLYVGNLSEDATASALRRRFEQCGNVTDVELAVDRGSGRKRGFAFVTMADAASMKSAIDQLDGSMFEDQPLRVTESSDEEARRQEGTGRGRKPVERRARIVFQQRERASMAYEVEAGGVVVSFRMYPTEHAGRAESWRIEACTKGAPERVVQAAAASRRAAFDELQRSWAEPPLDWPAIDEALAGVRAI